MSLEESKETYIDVYILLYCEQTIMMFVFVLCGCCV